MCRRHTGLSLSNRFAWISNGGWSDDFMPKFLALAELWFDIGFIVFNRMQGCLSAGCQTGFLLQSQVLNAGSFPGLAGANSPPTSHKPTFHRQKYPAKFKTQYKSAESRGCLFNPSSYDFSHLFAEVTEHVKFFHFFLTFMVWLQFQNRLWLEKKTT